MAISEKAKRGTHLLHGDTLNGVFANYDFISFINGLDESVKLTGLDYNGDTIDQSIKSIIESANLSLKSYDNKSTISLLPVRLETKFIDSDLWVRIFPDQVFVKSHKIELSQVEYEDGVAYWQAYFDAQGELEKQKEAWRRLCTKYETTRAAWIIKTLFPTNIVLNQVTIPDQAAIIDKVDSLIEELDLEVADVIGPKNVISLMESSIVAVKDAGIDIADSAENIFTTSEIIKLNGNYSQRRLKSSYDVFINPVLSSGEQQRRDDFLVKPYLYLRQSHQEVEVKIDEKKLNKNREAIDLLRNSIYIFTPSRTKKNSVLTYLTKFKDDFITLTGSWGNIPAQGFESFLLCDDLSCLKAALTTEQERFNPIQTNGKRIDEDAEAELIATIDEIDAIIQYWKNQIYFNNESIWFSISVLIEQNRNTSSKVDFDSFCTNLVTQFDTLNVANSGFATTEEDYGNILSYISSKYRDFSKVFLNAITTDVRLSTMGMTVLNAFQKSFQGLINDYVGAQLNENLFTKSLNVFLDRLNLQLNNPVLWVSEAASGLSQIESSIRFSDTRKDYCFIQLSFSMVYHLIIDRYFIQINSLQNPQNLFSIRDKSLDPNFKLLHGYYISGLKKLFFAESSVVTAIEIIEVSNENIVSLQPNYYFPTKAANKIKSWLTSLSEEVAALTDKRITADGLSYLQERTEEFLKKLDGEFVSQFCQSAESAGRLGHQTNPIVGNNAFAISSYMEALTAGKDELELITNSTNSSSFSFEFQGSAPTYPNVTIINSASSVQQYSDVLPTRFIAIGVSDSDSPTPGNVQECIKFVWPGKIVNQSIKFGFDPNGDEDSFTFEINELGEIDAHPDTKWMLDKDWAERNGLAIRIPLSSSDTYFSKILVIGVNEDDSSLESHSSRWKDLFESHQYTSGIELLPLDSPTNNSETQKSIYSTNEGLHDISYSVFAEAPLFTSYGASMEANITDGQRASEVIGLPYSSFFHVKGANQKSITNGIFGQRATFPGTIGAYMEEALDSILNRDNRERIEDYFSKFVSARGHSPSLRIGKQPYGFILTGYLQAYRTDETNFISISDFNYYDANFRPYMSMVHPVHNYDVIVPRNVLPNDIDFKNGLKTRFDVRQIQVLKALDIEWRRFAEKFGRNVYSKNVEFHAQQYAELRALMEASSTGGVVSPPSDYGQIHFNDILTLSPYSSKYLSRFVYSTASFKFIGGALQDPLDIGALSDDITQTIGQNTYLSSLPYLAGLTQINTSNALVVNSDQRVADFLVGAYIERGVYIDFSRSVWSELDPLTYNLSGTSNPLHARIQGARVFKTTNALESIALNGGHLKSSGDNSSPQSYLNWLRTTHPSDVFANNQQNNLPSKAVAFQLFRSAILYKYREAAAKLLVKEGLINDSQYNGLGSPERAIYHATALNEYIDAFVGASEELPENYQDYTSFFTKWDLLFTKFYRVHPYVLSDMESVISVNGQTSTDNRGNIEFGLREFTDIHLPWRDSKLLGYLLPNYDPQWGIYGTTDNFDPDHKIVADYLFGDDDIAQAHELQNVKSKLKKYISTLEHIESFDEKEIERILAEAVDLSTHRIDAWIQGLFAKRLQEIRRRRTSKFGGQTFDEGTYIAAYGYVENLFKNEQDDQDAVATSAAGNMPDAFIPAHSIGHAITSAILYNGYYINKIQNQNTVRNRSAVNLSSKRIRKALSVLKGVRAGSQLGMILGQEFERGLIDSAVYGLAPESNLLLDIYVYRLRKKFPLRISNGDLLQPNQVQAGEYLDGLALLDHVSHHLSVELNQGVSILDVLTDNILTSFSSLELDSELELSPSLSAQKQNELRIIAFYLNEMAETLDALSDLMISEGVFQIVNGNSIRAAASLDLFSNAGIAEPDIINSPQRLNYFQNRVIVNYPATGNSSWSMSNNPRRNVDAALNSWLVDLAGPSNDFAITYKYSDAGQELTSQYLIADLSLEPIDIIALVNPVTQEANNELVKFIVHNIKKDFPERQGVQLLWKEEVSSGQTRASELIRMLSIVKEMLLISGNIKSVDFESNSEDEIVGFNLVEFKNKVLLSRDSLASYKLELESLPSPTYESNVQLALELLERGVQFGLNGLLGPVETTFSINDSDSILLLESLVALAIELVSIRLDDTQNSIANLTASSVPSQEVYLMGKQILEIIFGGPTFIFPSIEFTSEFQIAVDNRGNLIPADESSMLEVWLHANSMIRKPLTSLLELRSMGDILLSQIADTNRPIDCQPVQYPFGAGDRWCGLPQSGESSLQQLVSGKQNIIFTNAELLNTGNQVCGFKLDDWQEIIPDLEVTSGIAIHKNQPLSESPQAIMIAVPTDNSSTWNWGINDIAHSVLQAIDMAKYRTVEPEQITLAINDPELDDLLNPIPDLRKHLSKIFPANMVEAYPATDAESTNNGIGGNRVSMDYSTNN
jgi:hypothetical protein